MRARLQASGRQGRNSGSARRRLPRTTRDYAGDAAPQRAARPVASRRLVDHKCAPRSSLTLDRVAWCCRPTPDTEHLHERSGPDHAPCGRLRPATGRASPSACVLSHDPNAFPDTYQAPRPAVRGRLGISAPVTPPAIAARMALAAGVAPVAPTQPTAARPSPESSSARGPPRGTVRVPLHASCRAFPAITPAARHPAFHVPRPPPSRPLAITDCAHAHRHAQNNRHEAPDLSRRVLPNTASHASRQVLRRGHQSRTPPPPHFPRTPFPCDPPIFESIGGQGLVARDTARSGGGAAAARVMGGRPAGIVPASGGACARPRFSPLGLCPPIRGGRPVGMAAARRRGAHEGLPCCGRWLRPLPPSSCARVPPSAPGSAAPLRVRRAVCRSRCRFGALHLPHAAAAAPLPFAIHSPHRAGRAGPTPAARHPCANHTPTTCIQCFALFHSHTHQRFVAVPLSVHRSARRQGSCQSVRREYTPPRLLRPPANCPRIRRQIASGSRHLHFAGFAARHAAAIASAYRTAVACGHRARRPFAAAARACPYPLTVRLNSGEGDGHRTGGRHKCKRLYSERKAGT